MEWAAFSKGSIDGCLSPPGNFDRTVERFNRVMTKGSGLSGNGRASGAICAQSDDVTRSDLVREITGKFCRSQLVLLHAASGYGKTFVLRSVRNFLVAAGSNVVWIDGHTGIRNYAEFCAALAKQLSSNDGAEPKQREFLELEKLSDSATNVCVIVDDWNQIQNDDLNRHFERLLSATGNRANFLVASSAMPGFFYEDMLLDGRASVFDSARLALTASEVVHALADEMIGLPESARSLLLEKVQGWPVGVHLLKLALQEVAPESRAEFEFPALHPAAFAYCQKRIFSALPKEVQQNLRDLAVLSSFTREKALHVLNDRRAGAIFDAMIRGNVPLNRIDATSSRYQFPSLFREFLISQRSALSTTESTLLLKRALNWHIDRSEIDDAIEYALRTGDGAAARLLLLAYVDRNHVPDSKPDRFFDWICRLEALGTKMPPELNFWRHWCEIFGAKSVNVGDCRTLGETENGLLIASLSAAYRDDYLSLRRFIDEWTANGSNGDTFVGAMMRSMQGVAHLMTGEALAASQVLSRAMLEIDQTSSKFGRIWIRSLAAFAAINRGQGIDAAELIVELQKLGEQRHRFHCGCHDLFLSVAGMTAALRADYAGAEGFFRQLRSPNEQRLLPIMVPLQTGWARALGQDDDHSSAPRRGASPISRIMDEIYGLDHRLRNGVQSDRVNSELQRLHANVDAIFIERPELAPRRSLIDECIAILRSQIQLSQGDFDGAEQTLKPILPEVSRSGRGLVEQKISLLRVRALSGQGKRNIAVRLLYRTADTAVRSEVAHFLISEYSQYSDLVPSLLIQGKLSPFGGDLNGWTRLSAKLSEMTCAADSALQGSEPGDRTELSEKELELLCLLAAGLSNGAISERVGITMSTVKWYLHNIYNKLGVGSRTAAVALMRQRRLIP